MNLKKISITLALLLLCTLVACGEAPDATKPTTEAKPSYTEITPFDLQGILKVENASPYSGVYIERGDDENKDRVENVTALAITNTGEKTILDGRLIFTDGEQELQFLFQMLPAGDVLTLVEYDKKKAATSDLQLVDSTIHYLQDVEEIRDSFALIGSEYGSIIVENTTDRDFPKVEIYYRRGYEEGTLGGLCYKLVLEDVGAEELVFADPDYWSENSAIVNILLLPEEEGDENVLEITPQ
jgi:hypothetical protein